MVERNVTQIKVAQGHIYLWGDSLINDCCKKVQAIIFWEGGSGLDKNAPESRQQAVILHCFRLKLLFEFCRGFPRKWTVTWKCELHKSFPSLSCFWVVFDHSNRENTSSLALARIHHQRGSDTFQQGRGQL